MYENVIHHAASIDCSPKAALYHKGTRHDAVDRCRDAVANAIRQGHDGIQKIVPLLLKYVSDARVLRAAWDYLAKFGGQAPGVNGLTYGVLDNSEIWNLLTVLGQAIRNGTYRPGPLKQVEIPKDRVHPEKGFRRLLLPNIEDRVVQRAVGDIIGPIVDHRLGPEVFGFRRGRNRLHALAYAERLAREQNRFVWVVEDLCNAFGRVPRKRLIDVVRRRIPNDDLATLIDRLMDTGRKRGIPQGGSLSPQMLNAYLDHSLDRRWRKSCPDIPLVRYADDLLLLCRTQKQAKEAWNVLDELLLPTGMSLKGQRAVDAMHDLRKGAAVDWLGFRLSRGDNALTVKIADRAWSRLADRLVLAHDQPNSPLLANAVINGWIRQMAPCYNFEDQTAVLRKLRDLANEQAFDEIPRLQALRFHWQQARDRWITRKTDG